MIELAFEKLNGLVPAIVQDHQSGEVLMQAFMNEEAWEKTLETGIAHYWSRSRGKLWKKGESSGNVQEVREIRLDCDRDCVLIKVHQVGGAACHTGYRSCFFNLVRNGAIVPDGQIIFDPKDKY
jgi:phosphoribosyl-AMP cyclohydrolase